MQLDKKEQRKQQINKRKVLDTNLKFRYDTILSESLISFLKPYQTIGIYVSKPEEVDTKRSIETLLQQNKTIAVPKVVGNTLEFYKITSLNDVTPGCFDVLEPITTERIQLTEFDVMIVPLVAFDAKHNRIGYGKGFYDSVLNEVSYKIGIAYPEQEVSSILCNQHDICLDGILTVDKKMKAILK